jgi:hypothetical protein
MQPSFPSWMKHRQVKAEAVGNDTYRLTGPNLTEAFISIRRGDNGRWAAAVRTSAEGPDLAVTEAEFERPLDAWGAACELYRQHVVY